MVGKLIQHQATVIAASKITAELPCIAGSISIAVDARGKLCGESIVVSPSTIAIRIAVQTALHAQPR